MDGVLPADLGDRVTGVEQGPEGVAVLTGSGRFVRMFGTARATQFGYSLWEFQVFGPGTAMNHSGITGNCASCHETGKTWYGVTMVDRPTKAQDANHPTTGDCSTCHASTTSFVVDTSGGKPPNHIPTSQSCSLCHADSGGM